MRWLFTTPLKVDHDRVVAAIREAQARTSGEIRVLVARHRARDPVAAARHHFATLEMNDSLHRNGILIFVAPRSRTFAVVGDRAIHEKCGDTFWKELASAMEGYFKKGDFTEGLTHGIGRAGALLAEHFPPSSGGGTEAPGDILTD